jgi:5'-nucleotidase / UDP-sugar diphosphatase
MSPRFAREGRSFAPMLVAIALAVALVRADGPAPVSLTFVHINDIYELDTMAGGHEGGLARVATVVDRQKARGPVLVTLGGDFLSPSAAGLAVVDGEPIAGRHAVDVLNTVGVQWATLGNHEFDLGEAVFHRRLAEAKFKVVISNVTGADARPLEDTLANAIVPVRAGGRTLRIGLIGIMLDSAKRPWIRYLPGIESARAQVAALKGRTDAIVAITHLALLDDRALVEAVPEIDLVLGGHEHENVIVRRSRHFTPIVKADSNALTAGIVTMTFPAPGQRPTVEARMQVIDDRIPKKPSVEARVRYWMDLAYATFEKNGFSPGRVVVTTTVELDGRSSVVRSGPSLLADITLAGMRREAGAVDVVMLNTGTLRIDDVIPPGPLTEYDVIRILPYTDAVMKMTMDGALLTRVLQAGAANGVRGAVGGVSGNGGYLRVLGATETPEGWAVAGQPIDPTARYTVAMTDYLISGEETGFPFLTRTNPALRDVQTLRDMRVGFIAELQARYGGARP